jgi:hypothetical protein
MHVWFELGILILSGVFVMMYSTDVLYWISKEEKENEEKEKEEKEDEELKERMQKTMYS